MNDELQVRYAVVRNGEEVEVAFEDMTDEEREEIADRLEREAMADKMHTDALARCRQRKFGFRPDEDTSGREQAPMLTPAKPDYHGSVAEISRRLLLGHWSTCSGAQSECNQVESVRGFPQSAQNCAGRPL